MTDEEKNQLIGKLLEVIAGNADAMNQLRHEIADLRKEVEALKPNKLIRNQGGIQTGVLGGPVFGPGQGPQLIGSSLQSLGLGPAALPDSSNLPQTNSNNPNPTMSELYVDIQKLLNPQK